MSDLHRWQTSKGEWVLSTEETIRRLSTKDRQITEKPPWRRVRHAWGLNWVTENWDRFGPRIPFVCKESGKSGYFECAVEVLRVLLDMAELGQYGAVEFDKDGRPQAPKDPFLNESAAARRAGCSKATIHKNLKPDGQHLGLYRGVMVDTFLQSKVDKLPDRWNRAKKDGTFTANGDGTPSTNVGGRRLSLKAAAKRMKIKFNRKPVPVPYLTLRKLLLGPGGKHKKKTQAAWIEWFPKDPMPTVEVLWAKKPAVPTATITEGDAKRIGRLIARELKYGQRLEKDGYQTLMAIAQGLGLSSPAKLLEFNDCMRCWEKHGVIQPKAALFLVPDVARTWRYEPIPAQAELFERKGRSLTRKASSFARFRNSEGKEIEVLVYRGNCYRAAVIKERPFQKLMHRPLFKPEEVHELWKRPYEAEGVRAMQKLLAAGQVDAREVGEVMGKLGIAGRRLGVVRRKAGAAIKVAGDGTHRRVYYLKALPAKAAGAAAPPIDERGKGQSDLERQGGRTDKPKKVKGKGGRRKGSVDPEVQQRKKEMLEAWDEKKYGDKKVAYATIFGFYRPDVSTWIKEHEAAKA